MIKSDLAKKLVSISLAATMLFGTSALTANAVDFKIGDIKSSINLNIPINGSGSTLELNRTYDLNKIVSGLTGLGYKVSFSNNSIIKHKNGKITTVGTGKVTVTITLRNGTKISKTFNITKPQFNITLSSTKLNMIKGQTKTLQAIIKQSNAKVNWSSSNNKVVSVDQNGKPKAVNAGTAVVTATSSTGKKASCTITVGNPVPVKSVNLKTKTVKLTVGQSYTLNATISPANASNRTVKYTTSNSKVATVKGNKITAKAPGTAKITVTSNNGKKAVCTVTVVKKTNK